jgi:hypothetical protein
MTNHLHPAARGHLLGRLLPIALALVLSGFVATVAGATDPVSSVVGSVIGGNCGATQTPFSRWGDTNAYYLATNGDFESGNKGWTLSDGAAVVPGNETFYVHSSSDDASLLLPAGATAVSPATCFGLLTPGVRLFARSTSGAPATLHVRLIAWGLLGALAVLDGGTATVGPEWAPTPTFSTTLSQLDVPVGTKSIQIAFSSSGPVQIDDVYIDPFVSH